MEPLVSLYQAEQLGVSSFDLAETSAVTVEDFRELYGDIKKQYLNVINLYKK